MDNQKCTTCGAKAIRELYDYSGVMNAYTCGQHDETLTVESILTEIRLRITWDAALKNNGLVYRPMGTLESLRDWIIEHMSSSDTLVKLEDGMSNKTIEGPMSDAYIAEHQKAAIADLEPPQDLAEQIFNAEFGKGEG